jgi:prepilin peptidase CpaA
LPPCQTEKESVVRVQVIGIILASLLCVPSVIYDMRAGIIPNWLTYPAILCGLAFGVVEGKVLTHLAGCGLAGGLFLVFWLANGVGAGDVKLMAAIGAVLGWPGIWDVIFFTALAGGVVAIVYLAVRKGSPPHGSDNKSDTVPLRKRRIPYAVAIAAGTWTAVAVSLF